ncbi:MAG: polysaccharide biosynthesis protein [Eubacteriales bacterium]|nr:polysaccharide biosynthesis protein [Eubacteriales bacterium]MDD4389246.1 polysaccharide biosynthesis protein [Eubacteriales bacterium]
MAKKTFIQGAAILGMAGIIVKILGAFFRIPLGNLIGDNGMAYYQAVYPVYNIFLAISTAGIPVAISKMVSERNALGRYHDGYRVFKVSFLLMFFIGTISFMICFFGAEAYFTACMIPEAKYAMMALAPALLIVPMMASFRGYFQGNQNMKPTAASQVVEQCFRVVTGLTLAFVFLKYGLEFAAAGAAFGATVGSLGGIIIVLLIFFTSKKKYRQNIEDSKKGNEESVGYILGRIVVFAVPITLGAAIMPIMNAIDVPIVMTRLQETAGFSYSEAKSLYGQLSGFSGSLINFPQVLTQAIAMSLVPVVAEMHKLKKNHELRDNIHTGLRMAIVVGLPCAVGLMVLAEPIMVMLYPMQKASAAGAAQCLTILAFGVIFLSSVQTLTGVLQGIGRQMVPVINMCFGAAAKIALTYWLTGIPDINVKGAAIGTVAAYIIASTLNLVAVKKYTGTNFDFTMVYLKPAISAIVMGIVAWTTHKLLFTLLGGTMATLIAIALAAFVYGYMLLKTRAVTRSEMENMPKGKKIVKIVDRFIK